MTDTDFHDELKQMFAEADGALETDSARFVHTVDRRIQRHMLVRRLVLASVTISGGLIAVLQAPDLMGLLTGIVGMDHDLAVSMTPLSEAIAGLDMRLLMALAVGSIGLFAALAADTH